MKRHIIVPLVIGLSALVACSKIDPITAPGISGGSANFGTYVALGTSLGAGYTNGGLVERHQRHSYAYLFAKAVNAPFTIPSISDSGIGPLLVLRSLSPLLITRAATTGFPLNFAQPTSYHDMSIPGALLVDAIDSSLYGRSPLFAIIQRGRGTLLQQALGLNPTFLSFEFGANELLGAATSGTSTLASPAFQPPSFAAMYTSAMNAIAAAAPNAKLALMNVPNVTDIPFFTTFSPITLCGGVPTPLIGPSGQLSPNDLVLLTAADSMAIGTGFPIGCLSYLSGAPGNGRPLPGSMILDAAETATIEGYVRAYNAIIDSVATGRGAALVDFNAVLRAAASTGLHYQGAAYTNKFLTGGLFGLDGVHPNDLGYGFFANAMVDAVNAKFGSNIPEVNLLAAATTARYGMRAAGRDGVRAWVPGLGSVVRELYGDPRAAVWRGNAGTRLPLGAAWASSHAAPARRH